MAIILFLATGSYKNFVLPTQAEAWIYFGIAGIAYGFFERLRFFATKFLDASIYSIVRNISVLIAFFLSLFLYQESLTFSKMMGFVLIIIALFLVVEIKKSKISLKGLWYGIVTSVLIGIGWSLDKKGSMFFNPETYNVMTWVAPLIIICIPSIDISAIKLEFKIFSWKIILLSLFNFIGYYLALKALFLAEATKVIPIMQLSTLMTVIAGILLLNEKNNLSKKILAGIIAVIGVFLLR